MCSPRAGCCSQAGQALYAFTHFHANYIETLDANSFIAPIGQQEVPLALLVQLAQLAKLASPTRKPTALCTTNLPLLLSAAALPTNQPSFAAVAAGAPTTPAMSALRCLSAGPACPQPAFVATAGTSTHLT